MTSARPSDGARVMTFVVDARHRLRAAGRPRRSGSWATFPDVRFVTVLSGDSKDEAKNLAIGRVAGASRWRVDEDGSLVNLYGVGVCPITVFARDGRVRATNVGTSPRRSSRRARERLRRMTEPDLELVDGWVEPELAEEFPELSLVHAAWTCARRASPREVKQRLRMLADRYTGGKVIHMRQDPVPWAYRVFSRQVGIDPDHDRTPVEAVALRRLKQGGLQSENLVDDALTIAIAETGVPLIALDAERVSGGSGCGSRGAGETLAGSRPLSARQIVVADAERPVALVLGEVARDAGVTPGDRAHDPVRARGQGRARGSASRKRCGRAAETLYTDASA